MLGLVQSWFAPKANPIGVDFGSDALRMAQVQVDGRDYRLIAAASADVPVTVRHDAGARWTWFVDTARDLLVQGRFKGRDAVLALPASSMFIQHLRVARMDDEGLKKALTWEARGKLPIDPSQALMRHTIAGEIYNDQEPRLEVVLMAAHREMVNQYLHCASKARLNVLGMNVEPMALVDCFGHIYRRKTDHDVTNFFIDIGGSGTRAVIARGTQILFARTIPLGGDHLTRAVASALKIGFDDARTLRLKLSRSQPALDENRDKHALSPAEPERASDDNSFALLGASLAAAEKRETPAPPVTAPATTDITTDSDNTPDTADTPADVRRTVEQATHDALTRLVSELDLCRKYYEATFPARKVDRLIFVGGESRHKALCQAVARQLSLAAQLGDPLVRMCRNTDVGPESGIDRRLPQPAWAVAIGLSLGPAGAVAEAVSAPARSRVTDPAAAVKG